jgi:hypothetical protein
MNKMYWMMFTPFIWSANYYQNSDTYQEKQKYDKTCSVFCCNLLGSSNKNRVVISKSSTKKCQEIPFTTPYFQNNFSDQISNKNLKLKQSYSKI